MADLSQPWVVDNPPSTRYPIYTRANVGEVFPDPVTPLSWTLAGIPETEPAWRDAYERFGVFRQDEFAGDDLELLGVFGGYCYLNVSLSRIFGVRVPGLTPEMIDRTFFGEQPGVPPYEPLPTDEDEERSAAAGATLQWILTTESLPELLDEQQAMEELRAARPDVSAMTDRELVDRAVDLIETWFRRLFAQHIFVTYAATVPTGIIAGVTQAVGQPELALKLMAGLGGVDSAAPSWAMWDLGRMVAGSPALMALFDAGADGLLDRLRASDDDDATKLVAAFDQFLYEFGSRGPNEWEMRSPTWETRPGLALAAVDRMRLSPASASPQGHQDALAADREAVSATVAALVEGDPETHGQLLAALRSASIFLPGRERSKTNIIRLVHESRWCMREVGRRMVERGHFEDVEDFGFVRKDELDRLVDDPASLVDDVRARKAWYAELAEREPPFITVGQPPPASEWPLRRDAHVERAVSGDVLPGLPGCPGAATGTARVLLSPDDPTALNPGDVLVAPITDPSWTPLFVPAAAVVVDTGAQLSHAIIVSRELGIPCVVSVTGATRRIQDGATVTVDGTSGTVTVH